MSQSLSKIIVHLIFSTKNREPWLDDDVRPKMHAYLATVCRDLGCEAYRVGGTADHVHLLATLSRNIAPSQMVENIKKLSSKWIKGLGNKYSGFYWQSGYGLFSVSQSHFDQVIKYIENQMEHHRRIPFQEEYRNFLEKYQVQYNEKYVWD